MLLKRTQPTDAGAVHDSETAWIYIGSTSVLKGLEGGSHGELFHRIGAPRLLGAHVVRRGIPIGECNGARTGGSGTEEPLPERFLTHSAGRDHSVAGDGDAPSTPFHQSLPMTNS